MTGVQTCALPICSITFGDPIATTITIVELAEELVRSALADHPNEGVVSLLAISLSGLVEQPSLQLELPFDDSADPSARGDPTRAGSPVGSDRWAVDQAMDRVRARFGKAAVGYVSIALANRSGVPDAFRELAEHEL